MNKKTLVVQKVNNKKMENHSLHSVKENQQEKDNGNKQYMQYRNYHKDIFFHFFRFKREKLRYKKQRNKISRKLSQENRILFDLFIASGQQIQLEEILIDFYKFPSGKLIKTLRIHALNGTLSDKIVQIAHQFNQNFDKLNLELSFQNDIKVMILKDLTLGELQDSYKQFEQQLLIGENMILSVSKLNVVPVFLIKHLLIMNEGNLGNFNETVLYKFTEMLYKQINSLNYNEKRQIELYNQIQQIYQLDIYFHQQKCLIPYSPHCSIQQNTTIAILPNIQRLQYKVLKTQLSQHKYQKILLTIQDFLNDQS